MQSTLSAQNRLQLEMNNRWEFECFTNIQESVLE